jgi:L-fucose mutarotase
MLIGISPNLSPDLLSVLASMGHGDEIGIVDANFPAAANARRLCRADGRCATDMLTAILSLMPIDDFEPRAAWRMAVVDEPSTIPPVCHEFAGILHNAGYKGSLEPLEREDFYARSRNAFAIVATGETRLYGNILIRKGVVRPQLKDRQS